ncbi:MAG: hypothetical protein ACI97A_000529 [Planctomycetota bacterium]|jgi:hypothetical protein
MKRSLLIALLLSLTFVAISDDAWAQKKPKLKETVTFAQTWDAAVEEAKLLNVPMVLHSHGFY